MDDIRQSVPSLDLQHYIDLCYNYAKLSTCSKARFGSIIVTANENLPLGLRDSSRPERIVGKGWNHSPNPACEDCAALCAGKLRLGVKSGTRIELCYAVHAEQYALLQAGTLAKDGAVFVTGYDGNWQKNLKKNPEAPVGHPTRGFYCSMCARLMWAAGIKWVVCDSVFNTPIVFSIQDVWDASYLVADSIEKTTA